MIRESSKPVSDTNASLKPGSSAEDAHKLGGDGDFGAPAGPSAERDYVSRNTKASDPGAAQPFDWEKDGVCDHGAGGRASGPGSASGGDLDPDVVGVGTGGSGSAASGKIGRSAGPDDSDGTSDEFASGGHAPGREPTTTRIHGTTHFADAGGDGEGADAATSRARDDDSFAGEVSSGEARGQDNARTPDSNA